MGRAASLLGSRDSVEEDHSGKPVTATNTLPCRCRCHRPPARVSRGRRRQLNRIPKLFVLRLILTSIDMKSKKRFAIHGNLKQGRGPVRWEPH